MNNGAGISTEAQASTASGGNITLRVRDFLYLVSSEITTLGQRRDRQWWQHSYLFAAAQ